MSQVTVLCNRSQNFKNKIIFFIISVKNSESIPVKRTINF